jgi:hypothetical protein
MFLRTALSSSPKGKERAKQLQRQRLAPKSHERCLRCCVLYQTRGNAAVFALRYSDLYSIIRALTIIVRHVTPRPFAQFVKLRLVPPQVPLRSDVDDYRV